MKKHHVVLIVALVLVAAGSVLAVRHWDDYKVVKTSEQNNQVEQAKKTQFDSDQKIYGDLVDRYNSAVAQCQVGASAYAKLPATSKTAATPAPVCPAELAQ